MSYLKSQIGDCVEFIYQKIESIKEVFSFISINFSLKFNNQDYALIVNCAGLGGGKLAGDDENVFPNRGVGIVVKAPGQSHFCYQDSDTFIIPMYLKKVHFLN